MTIVEMPFDASGPINTVERLKAKLEKVDAAAVLERSRVHAATTPQVRAPQHKIRTDHVQRFEGKP